MENDRIGRQSVRLSRAPSILGFAAVAGKKEGKGPLSGSFDFVSDDDRFGEKSWEKAESAMLRQCFELACGKAGVSGGALDYIFAGDLLNQCCGSAFALRDVAAPYFGLYGACSTMAESLSLAAMAVDAGFARTAAALTSSHFCSAERQFRFPLEYGCVRTPTAQWTVTGAGALILSAGGAGPYVTRVTTGMITDAGITDANNMGAAMAPAAASTLAAHFADTGRGPDYYDLIVTGDLGRLGHELCRELLELEGIAMPASFTDCGMLIYDAEAQDVHCGGSGCGCSASVLCGRLLRGMATGEWERILFAAIGALMSPTSSMQGESIPGVCHAVAIEKSVG